MAKKEKSKGKELEEKLFSKSKNLSERGPEFFKKSSDFCGKERNGYNLYFW